MRADLSVDHIVQQRVAFRTEVEKLCNEFIEYKKSVAEKNDFMMKHKCDYTHSFHSPLCWSISPTTVMHLSHLYLVLVMWFMHSTTMTTNEIFAQWNNAESQESSKWSKKKPVKNSMRPSERSSNYSESRRRQLKNGSSSN